MMIYSMSKINLCCIKLLRCLRLSLQYNWDAQHQREELGYHIRFLLLGSKLPQSQWCKRTIFFAHIAVGQVSGLSLVGVSAQGVTDWYQSSWSCSKCKCVGRIKFCHATTEVSTFLLAASEDHSQQLEATHHSLPPGPLYNMTVYFL